LPELQNKQMPLSSLAKIIAELQWRDQEPASRDAESHLAYVERRIVEMSHARDAHTAWMLFEKGADGMNWLRHLHKLNDRARSLYRVSVHQSWGDFYLPRRREPFECGRVKEHNLGVFERRFKANRWDFCSSSSDKCPHPYGPTSIELSPMKAA
jgi:hypothetical protein